MIGTVGPLATPRTVLDGIDVPARPSSPAAGVADSFAAALADVTNNAVGTLRNAEEVSVRALQGNADTREVVDAVMSAEQTLQAAVAIRDKIVAAYLEISRMGI